MIIAVQPARCSFSVECISVCSPTHQAHTTRGLPAHLPLLKIILLRLVLLDEVIEDLSEAFLVGLEGWHYILDGPLDKHAVDEAETLSVSGERL